MRVRGRAYVCVAGACFACAWCLTCTVGARALRHTLSRIACARPFPHSHFCDARTPLLVPSTIPRQIARTYLKRWFWIDLLGSIPWEVAFRIIESAYGGELSSDVQVRSRAPLIARLVSCASVHDAASYVRARPTTRAHAHDFQLGALCYA